MKTVIKEHIVQHVTISFTGRLDVFHAPHVRAELDTPRVDETTSLMTSRRWVLQIG